jgi:hypothetical protein
MARVMCRFRFAGAAATPRPRLPSTVHALPMPGKPVRLRCDVDDNW